MTCISRHCVVRVAVRRDWSPSSFPCSAGIYRKFEPSGLLGDAESLRKPQFAAGLATNSLHQRTGNLPRPNRECSAVEQRIRGREAQGANVGFRPIAAVRERPLTTQRGHRALATQALRRRSRATRQAGEIAGGRTLRGDPIKGLFHPWISAFAVPGRPALRAALRRGRPCGTVSSAPKRDRRPCLCLSRRDP